MTSPAQKNLSLVLTTFCLISISVAGTAFADCDRNLAPDYTYRKAIETIERNYADVDAINLRFAEDAAQFDSQVKLVSDPQEGFLTKVLMIRQAEVSIALSTYIFAKDAASYALLSELRSALERGVDLRVMVDALGTPDLIKAGLRSLLSVKPGLRKDGTPAQLIIKEFNPILSTSSVAKIWYNKLRNLFRSSYEKVPQRYVSPNRRSHDKMLVTDVDDPERSLAMFGGRNISEAYYNIPEGGDETFNDLEILIRNPPGSTSNPMGDRIGLHFSRLFFFLGNRYLTKLLLDPINPRVRFHLSKMTKAQETAMPQGGQVDTLLQKMQSEDYLHSGFTDAKSMILNETQNISRNRALTDPDANGELNSSSIIGQITLRATQAVKTIDLISPYIYFKPEEVQFFHRWLGEDPDRRLRIITNSVGTGDNMPAQAMIDEFVAPQFMLGPGFQDVRAQVMFYAYGKLDGIRYGGTSAYGKLHAKYGVIDNRFSVVTSSNGDPRSRNLNSEVAVFTDSPEIANQLTEGKTKELVEKSYLWGSQEWRALREHPKNSFKMLQERVFGHLIKIFKLMPLI